MSKQTKPGHAEYTTRHFSLTYLLSIYAKHNMKWKWHTKQWSFICCVRISCMHSIKQFDQIYHWLPLPTPHICSCKHFSLPILCTFFKPKETFPIPSPLVLRHIILCHSGFFFYSFLNISHHSVFIILIYRKYSIV